MFCYEYKNQSWRRGRPGKLISDVDLGYKPVPGRLESASEPGIAVREFYFKHDPEAETYICRFNFNGDHYMEIDDAPCKVYQWFPFNESGEGFLFYRPPAEVMRIPYHRKAVRYTATAEGVSPTPAPEQARKEVTF